MLMLTSLPVPAPQPQPQLQPSNPYHAISGEEWKRSLTDQQRRQGDVLPDEVAFFQGL
jgi:hypothetical protein